MTARKLEAEVIKRRLDAHKRASNEVARQKYRDRVSTCQNCNGTIRQVYTWRQTGRTVYGGRTPGRYDWSEWTHDENNSSICPGHEAKPGDVTGGGAPSVSDFYAEVGLNEDGTEILEEEE